MTVNTESPTVVECGKIQIKPTSKTEEGDRYRQHRCARNAQHRGLCRCGYCGHEFGYGSDSTRVRSYGRGTVETIEDWDGTILQDMSN